MGSLSVWLPGPMFLGGGEVCLQGVCLQVGVADPPLRIRKVVDTHPTGMLPFLLYYRSFN